MDKKAAILLMSVFLLALALACSISYEGISIGDDPEDVDRQLLAQEMTDWVEPEQEGAGESTSGVALPAESPASTSAPAAGLPAVSRTEINDYQVQAANFDCICAVDSDVVTSKFIFDGDTLNVLDAEGNTTDAYQKTGENTYAKSFMGYYILVNESGESTQVDEERRTVITFTSSGYTMEHYKGDSSAACCIHTFTEK